MPDANAAARCPICNKPAEAGARPFCSTRCADVDLGRWFTGHYSVPVKPSDEEAETGGA